MQTIPLEDVKQLRTQLARAHVLAAERFRQAYELDPSNPHIHLTIQAGALLETACGVRLRGGGAIQYDITGNVAIPYVERGKPLYPFFTIAKTPLALLEYWLIVSELTSSSASMMTKLIAESGEYDDALRRMTSPQIVRALIPTFLPAAELRDDGTALLTVTLYTRATEERIERRTLALDAHNELHFHSRELLAEGRGGVLV
jgi:hypothetical protein